MLDLFSFFCLFVNNSLMTGVAIVLCVQVMRRLEINLAGVLNSLWKKCVLEIPHASRNEIYLIRDCMQF